MFKYAVAFAALLAVSLAVEIPFDTCDGWPRPTSVTVPECAAIPCDLNVGDQITVNFNILLEHSVVQLPTLVSIEYRGETVTFPLPTGDACGAIAGGCPLDAGEHTVSFPVSLDGMPEEEETRITVAITDENGYAISCGSVSTNFHA